MGKVTSIVLLLALINVFLPTRAIIFTGFYAPYEHMNDKPGNASTASAINVTLNSVQVAANNGVSSENLKSNLVSLLNT